MDQPTPVYEDHAPLRPILLAALATALLTGLSVMIAQIVPRPTWQWLPVTAFLAAGEGIATTHWLAQPERRFLSRPRYRAAEFLVLAVFLRLFTWFLTGGLPGPATIRDYFLSPFSIFDATFTAYLIIAALAWERGITWSKLFLELRLSEAEIAYYTLPARQQTARHADRPIDRVRPEVFARFVKSWLNGGMWLALATTLTSVDITQFADERLTSLTRLGLHPQIFVALLVYFLLGLWLVSQARLLMMRSRWTADNVATTPDMARTWNRSTFALIAVVALVASLLPIGRTFGLAALIEFVMRAGLAIMQFVFLLFSGLLVLILGLLGVGVAQEMPESETAPVPAPTPPLPTGTVSETPALIMGGLFWLIVVALVVLALVFFLRDRGVALEWAIVQRWWTRLRSWLRTLWQRGAERATVLRAALGQSRETESAEPVGPGRRWRFLRVNALPPREQVRYFYLSTVRRAGEQGVARGPGETPSEYAGDLKTTWPDADDEIDTLTGAFLEARYSRQPIAARDVNPIREVWQRVRQALRRRREGVGR